MPDVWVSNASPLILLSHINQLNLLPELNPKIVIPHAVVLEVSVNRQDSNLNQFLSSPGVEELESPLQVEANIAGWDLGKGESEVLSWALKHPGSEVLLDDLAARRCARSLGIPLRGTVGIILLAKKRGIISQASVLIEELIKSGTRFDRKWITDALSLVGEKINF